MDVKFKKLSPEAVVPSYAKPGDAGLDLTSISVIEESNSKIVYSTGIAMEIPEGYVGLLFPRSSTTKKDLMLANSVGVIDSGYRGPLNVCFNKTKGENSLKFAVGDRVAQLVIIPIPHVRLHEVDTLSNTERGEGGWGSSGA
jgi:dUTP pyrophosphatase